MVGRLETATRRGLSDRVLKPLHPSNSGAPFTVAGLGKLIERAGVAAKIGFKVHLHTAKTIPPAVVASALRSSNTAPSAYTDPPHTLDGRGVISRCMAGAVLARKKAVNLSRRVRT